LDSVSSTVLVPERALEFSSLRSRVSNDTLKAITIQPFTLKTMTPVQAEVLPLLPKLVEPYSPDRQSNIPRDLLVKAKTGTGKTLAFLIPAIERRLAEIERAGKKAVVDAGLVRDKTLESQARRQFARTNAGALILSPTRELATQIAKEAIRLTTHHKDFGVQLFVGGESKPRQIRDWMKGRRDIVVATTGRLRDMLDSEPEVAKGLANTELVGHMFGH
jgi:ATP-dependent RNA helicase MSS116, mitochondrial